MNSPTQNLGLDGRDFPLSFLQWCFFVWHNFLLWQIHRMNVMFLLNDSRFSPQFNRSVIFCPYVIFRCENFLKT